MLVLAATKQYNHKLHSLVEVLLFVTRRNKHDLKTALFRGITQRVVVIPCRRFGTTCRSHLQESCSSSIGTRAHCGLWPVEQCPSIFFLSATNSLHLLTPST